MECVVPNRYIKLLAKSIQCMAKVGEELFIEATEHRLTFRALNPSRSAFMAFYLDERFFDSYSLEDGIERKYQVKLKPCQAVFRQFNTVETCTIRLDEFEQRLVFELLCKHGIKKVYKLSFEECEPLQALYTKDNVPNRVVAVPKKLVDSLNNFHNQLDEVTLIATKDSLKIKSYVDDAKAAGKVLQTELSIDVQDFDAFEIRNETQVTFCLKEIKAILGFCDASGQPVTILFERSGRPITLSIKYFGVFEADFVLATLVDQNLSSQSTGTSTSSGSSSTPSTPLTSSSPSTNTSNSNDNSRKRKVDDIQAWSPTTDKSPSSVNSTPMSSQGGVTPSKPSSSASSIHSTTPSVGSSNPHNNNNALDDDDNLQFGMDTEGPGADYQDLEQQDGTPPLKKQRSLSQSGPPQYNISSRVQDYNTNVDEDMDHMVEDDEEVPDSFDES